ncbi:MBL fold metallo-hydrolase [Halobacteriales archaeon QH_10_67_13]|nr:MAG: MBL fold metallo-hydrolase [Halobacteriales archaeon QH_10_67_13]
MRRIVVIALVVGVVGLAGCVGPGALEDGDGVEPDKEAGTVEVTGQLETHHIDVGQADATLIRTPADETILIDSGGWRQDGSDVIEYLDEQGVDRIDHLVATHPHADHIGGHAAIIEAFETDHDGIGTVYDAGVPHTSQTYENYLDAVDEHGHELQIVRSGDELPLAGQNVTATVLNPPEGADGADLHDASVGVLIEFGDVRYLTTGDAEQEVEAQLLERWAGELDADIYQAGHHGSSTSSSEAFLDAVDPEIAIISSALDSQYGHPHDETLEAFADREIETYWTGTHGDVVVTTDGSTVDVTTTEAAPTDPTELLGVKSEAASEAIDPRAAIGVIG